MLVQRESSTELHSSCHSRDQKDPELSLGLDLLKNDIHLHSYNTNKVYLWIKSQNLQIEPLNLIRLIFFQYVCITLRLLLENRGKLFIWVALSYFWHWYCIWDWIFVSTLLVQSGGAVRKDLQSRCTCGCVGMHYYKSTHLYPQDLAKYTL